MDMEVSRGTSVSTVVRLRAGKPRNSFAISGGGRDFSLLQSVQISCGDPLNFCLVGTGALCSEVSRPGPATDDWPPSSARVIMRGAVPPQAFI